MSITKSQVDESRCVDCNLPTHFGSGRFINRVPGEVERDGKNVEGFICAECQYDDCDACDRAYCETHSCESCGMHFRDCDDGCWSCESNVDSQGEISTP